MFSLVLLVVSVFVVTDKKAEVIAFRGSRGKGGGCYILAPTPIIWPSSCPCLGTKVFVMPNGMLKSNQQLVDIIEKVKPEIRLLIEKCNTVRQGLVTCGLTSTSLA